MTLGTSVLLLALAVAGIVLVYKFLRKKPKLRIICLVLLSLIVLVLAGYIGLTLILWMLPETNRLRDRAKQ